jgi:hypothetical protein
MTDPLAGFHDEWTTVGDVHRVHIAVRDGFPTSAVYDALRSASIVLTVAMRSARIVEAFHDDTHGVLAVHIVTTDPADAARAGALERALNDDDAAGPWVSPHVLVVAPSPHQMSDHYCHARYLAEQYHHVHTAAAAPAPAPARKGRARRPRA